jgi:hydroxymethylbilane synthase
VLLGIEVSYKRTPLTMRERLDFRETEVPEALRALMRHRVWREASLSPKLVCQEECVLTYECAACPRAIQLEAALLSTCNRTGVYALGGCPEPLARFLVAYKGLAPEELRPHLAVYEGRAVVEHLFAVAAGLESQVLGEPQILGQVRRAYEFARQAEAVGPILDELFQQAIRVGKRVRAETELGRRPASLATVAVERAARVYPDLSRVEALLLGTGEMGRLVARLLCERGIQKLWVASRSPERAAALARELDARALAIQDLEARLRDVDVVISATEAAQDYVLRAEQLRWAQGRDRELFLVDLGVPRTLDPEIKRLPGVQLHDLDDLKALSEEARRHREREVPKAWAIVREETEDYWAWLHERRASPLIRKLHERAERIRREQLEWALPKLGPLNEHQRRVIETLTARLVNKLLHAPTAQLRTLARLASFHGSGGDGQPDPLELAARLFQLELDAQVAALDLLKEEPAADAEGAERGSEAQAPKHLSSKKTLVVGTRGSALARAQTRWMVERLQQMHPDVEFVEQIIKTSGDRGQIKEIGAFVKELEEALQRGEIDMAVHSLKDLPTRQPEGLVIGALLERADPRDVLISQDGLKLRELPAGARVGTGSPRRAAQLLALRSDLEVVPIRGNVDTRLRKLAAGDGEVDALILAKAGLDRLGLAERVTEVLPPEAMLPAVGQGALAVEVRADDAFVLELVKALDHPGTRAGITAERAFLQTLGGGCRVPIAAYGRVEDGKLVLDGLVSSPDGRKVLRGRVEGSSDEAEALGRKLAERLLAQGAEELLRERVEQP